MTAQPPPGAPVKHGTYTAYFWHDCRCDACRTAHNSRVKRNRLLQLETGNLSHGRRAAYDAGCRCDLCKQARREAYVRLEVPAP